MFNSKNSVKVVHIIDDLGLGGAQRQLTQLIKALPRNRYAVQVISLSTNKTTYEKEIREADIPLTLISHKGKWSWSTLWKVYRKLCEVKPHIVHTWLFTAEFYGHLAAILAGCPRIVNAMRSTIEDLPWHYRQMSKFLSRWTSRITINAETTRGGLITELKIPDFKIRTIPNGIDLSSFPVVHANGQYRGEWQIPSDARIVTMVARMAPPKDHATFINAAARVAREMKDVYFVLVGDGPLRSEVENLITKLDLNKRVKIAGARRDVWELLHHVDLCVLATHYEGCSNVIMEAMAAGKPVIATEAGGNAELVVHGQTGWMVPPRDSTALAQAILEMLSDPIRARKMGAEGRARIEKHFSLKRVVSENESLYQEILSNGKKQ